MLAEECNCTNDNIYVDNRVVLGLFCSVMIDCELASSVCWLGLILQLKR